MSATPTTTESAASAQPSKDTSREGRLSFKKFGEHQMRRQFKELALEQCKPQIHAFGKCAEENGLMVVWTCRSLHKEIHSCMSKHNSKEAFEKYKEENKHLL